MPRADADAMLYIYAFANIIARKIDTVAARRRFRALIDADAADAHKAAALRCCCRYVDIDYARCQPPCCRLPRRCVADYFRVDYAADMMLFAMLLMLLMPLLMRHYADADAITRHVMLPLMP